MSQSPSIAQIHLVQYAFWSIWAFNQCIFSSYSWLSNKKEFSFLRAWTSCYPFKGESFDRSSQLHNSSDNQPITLSSALL